ncbi:MAGE family-domain-containing protein [Gaertneriomyces semiglobifer]|nr:MAGE family-domain-containing protein [Gaertneriomyces semiglobifer]
MQGETQGASRRTQASQRLVDEDADDEVVEPMHSQASSQIPGLLYGDEMHRKVKDFVRYALAMEHKRKPIRRQDINQKVLKEHNKYFKQVFDLAQEKLRGVFGLEMTPVGANERRSNSQAVRRAAALAGGNTGSAKAWILTVTTTPSQRESLLNWGEEQPLMVLLCVILGVIYTNGGCIEEGVLYRHLRQLGIERGQHQVFGSMDQVFADFIAQSYLNRHRQTDSEGDVYEYTIGPRSKVELPEKNLIEFMTAMYPGLGDAALKRLEKDIKRLGGSRGVEGESTQDM